MINNISSVSYINTKKRINSNQNIDKTSFEKKKVVVKKVKKKTRKSDWFWKIFLDGNLKNKRSRLTIKDVKMKSP